MTVLTSFDNRFCLFSVGEIGEGSHEIQSQGAGQQRYWPLLTQEIDETLLRKKGMVRAMK